jgi:site-specific DNA recombinase
MDLAIYARRSRPEELEPGDQETSTERQVTDCRKLAELKGWHVPPEHIYREAGVSGYTGKRRDAFSRLIAALEAGEVKGVICWKLDRLSRNRRDLDRLLTLAEQRGVVIASVTEGLDTTSEMGGFVLELLGGIARMESKAISARTRRAKEELARVGKPAGGGRRRFGFEPDQRTIREDEAVLIREAASRIMAGAGTSTVSRDWNRRGLRMPGGSPWQPTPLRRILLQPRTAGLRQHRGEVAGDAVWPAIIDRATWERLRTILLDPARRQGGRPSSYLLTGLVFCGRCEPPLRMFGRHKDGRAFYTCQAGKGGCNLKITAEPFEAEVRDRLLAALAGPKLAELRRRAAQGDQEAQRLSAAKQEAEADLAHLARLHGSGDLKAAEWLAAREPLMARIEAMETTLARWPNVVALADLPDTGDELEAAWESWTLDRRRAVLRAVVESVTVLPIGRATAGRFDPARVKLHWLV